MRTSVQITGDHDGVSTAVVDYLLEVHGTHVLNASRLVRFVLDGDGSNLWRFTSRRLHKRLGEGAHVVSPHDARWTEVQSINNERLLGIDGRVLPEGLLRRVVSGRLLLDEDYSTVPTSL